MKRYYIYRNLHKNKFSVKYSGKVINHVDSAMLTNVIFKVSEKGQTRVRQEKRKNVHATLQADSVHESSHSEAGLREIYYNPYTTDTFIYKDTGERVYKTHKVLAKNNKIYEIK